MSRWFCFSVVCAVLAACSDGTADGPTTPPPRAVTLKELAPGLVLPRSTLVVTGVGISADVNHTLLVRGTTLGESGGTLTVNLALPLRRLNDTTATHVLTDTEFTSWGPGRFSGTAAVRSARVATGQTVDGAFVVANARLVTRLTPAVTAVASGLTYLNSKVSLVGSGLLVSDSEGYTTAALSGCFLPDSIAAPCSQNGANILQSVTVQPEKAGLRDRGYFILDPKVLGIASGKFTGKISLTNTHWNKATRTSGTKNLSLYLDLSRVDSVSPTTISLGQYLDLTGKGFVGGADGSTSLAFSGVFTPKNGGKTRTVSFSVVPQVLDGQRARYVVEEKTGIGSAVPIRRETGLFSGSWMPTIYYKSVSQVGQKASLKLNLGPVKQVVWVRFVKGWNDGLRRFGLAAADTQIHRRILDVLARDYRAINVSFQTSEPKNFKLYAKIDIGGADPNGLGLLGYDNTPGKDVDNKRLYDWIGGVNALTQEDGYPGYGGVFLESLFGFSQHPPSGLTRTHMSSPLFDQLFDRFRPDRGTPLSATEAVNLPVIGSTAGCPTPDGQRLKAAACAIRVLGNVIGSTASHELGHSLGLADPYGLATDLHNPGDKERRLMDAGRNRPFTERAELSGKGPAVFCKEEFKYLQAILPPEGSSADPTASRPSCY